MSRRKIKNRAGRAKRSEKQASDFATAVKRNQILRRNQERAMDNEAISRYIYNKEFDMEHRYNEAYRAEWAKKANMTRSRFSAALDRVIKEAWGRIRSGELGDTEK